MNNDEIKNVQPVLHKANVVRSPLWEDVAHLYLGCEVIGTYNDASGIRGYLTGITNGGTECEIQFILEDGFNVEEEPTFNLIKEVKPILRPLSDLKPYTEEANEWAELKEYCWNGDKLPMQGVGEMTRWLLSKHFDIFRLIENGLALDASKFNVVSER